jgi:hypothetical protein
MAISSSAISGIGGAASDLFAGFGAQDKGALQAAGLRITAQGTRISAASTRISAQGLRTKAQGDLAEASNYDLAAALALRTRPITEQSTRVQQAQLGRQVTQAIGGQQAGVAGRVCGQRQRARHHAGLGVAGRAGARRARQQGAITEAGFDEQAKSFQTMSAAGRATAASEFDIANQTDTIAASRTRSRGSRTSWR